MRNGKSDWVRVGDIIGRPTPVDPSRPAEQGGAERMNSEPDFPIYRVRCFCPRCQRPFVGTTFRPQYDDDPPQGRHCDPCIDAIEAAVRERERREAEERKRDQRKQIQYTKSAPLLRAGDM